jgi:hypothetical protein
LEFSKAEFNGIGGLLIYIRIVPTCGTFLPVNFGPGLPTAGWGRFYLNPARSQAAAHRQTVSAGLLDDQAHSGG